jgi:phage/plasmid-like protein (TIGR03299 family)
MPAGDIEAMFSVRQNAWHDPTGRFTRDRYPSSIAQAREWAGQQWEPVEAQGFERIKVDDAASFGFGDQDVVVELADGRYIFRPIAGEKRVIRSDTGAHLRTVLDTYEIIGNGTMWAVIEAICDQPNVMFETGGVLDGGRRVWALARLDEPWSAPGDPSLTYPYVAFLNRHDGRASAKTVNTTERIVCKNTFGAADAEGKETGREYNFRHTKNVMDRIEEAKQALRGLREDTRAWQELATQLALMPVTTGQRELFVTEFIPMPPEGIISDRVVDNVEEARKQIRAILDGVTCEGIAYTAYGLVQAAGEYLDHVRRHRNRDTYVTRTLLKPEPLKAKAVQLAREVVATGV